MKYIIIIEHNYEKTGKLFTYLKLENTDKTMAFAEGVLKGFAQKEIYKVYICKRIKKNKFIILACFYNNGKNSKQINNLPVFTICEKDIF